MCALLKLYSILGRSMEQVSLSGNQNGTISMQESCSMASNAQEAENGVAQRKQYCHRQKRGPYEHVIYFCSISVASYVGLFCRLYLSQLVRWDGVPYFSSLYPQMVGTAVMGFVTGHRKRLKNAFLYQATATGLCGSITTFSSWNQEAIDLLLQQGAGANAPDMGVRVLGWATILLLGFGMSAAALLLGQQLAALSPWADAKLAQSETQQQRPTGHFSTRCHIVEGNVFICMWLVATALVVTIPYIFGRRELVVAALLAPLGAYIRWHLSPFNSSFQNVKLGTFAVNVTGAWLLSGVAYARQQNVSGTLGHDVLFGVANGFCGCLTTVSTLIFELSTLSLVSACVYALLSIAVAEVGMIAIGGALIWTST